MSTHDPLVFAGLERAQVRIFRRNSDGFAMAEVPDQDPKGMGVAAILTSDLFRLRSTLDSATQADLDRQRILAMKKELDPQEEEELRALKVKLSALGFTQTIRDPLYQLFLEAWTQREDPAWVQAVQLTPQQRRDRARLAAQIVEELRREGKES